MSMKKLVLGIDGGQSHTEAVIGDAGGRILAKGHGGASNHINEAGAEERFRKAIGVSVDDALSSLGLKRQRVTFVSAHFGLSGGPELREPIIRELLEVEKLSISEDTSNALWSVTAGANGVIVIAGSGSNAFGKKGSRTCRVGGWGYILGDEGSGYYIGWQALKHVFRAHEGRDRWGWLAMEIFKRSKAPTIRALHDAVYAGTFNKLQIGELAKLVNQGVRKDRQCRLLLKEAADDLCEIAEKVIVTLRLHSAICGFVGKVFESATVRRRFAEKLRRRFPRLKVKPPSMSPGEAAFQIAVSLLTSQAPAVWSELYAARTESRRN
jgi:N-acetylglucosamine kinase-like BadF-type ATPase